jgi:hypothetical protein
MRDGGDGSDQQRLILDCQGLGADQPWPVGDQLDKTAAQRDRCGKPRRLAALRFTANLDDDTLALGEPAAAGKDLALRQKRRPLAADLNECGAKRRQQARDTAEMDAGKLVAVATLDPKLDRAAVFEQCRPPLAGTGGDYELAAHRGR